MTTDFGIIIKREEIVDYTDETIAIAGRTFADMIRFERNRQLCARDGHDWERIVTPAICRRCHAKEEA